MRKNVGFREQPRGIPAAPPAASADLVSVVQNDHRILGFADLDYDPADYSSTLLEAMTQSLESLPRTTPDV